MTHCVIVDLGHLGKPSRLDPGVVADLDGDGITAESGEREIDVTADVLMRTLVILVPAGVRAAGWGEYAQRHRRAAQIARDAPGVAHLYLQLHCDIPGAMRRALYDSRSTLGRVAAQRFSIADFEPTAASPTNAWSRAHYCIAGIYAGPANICGLCVELGALENVAAVPGLVAERLADAIHAWAAP